MVNIQKKRKKQFFETEEAFRKYLASIIIMLVLCVDMLRFVAFLVVLFVLKKPTPIPIVNL